ncbi:MAG: hypothetical protein RLZ10_1888 [Bacteroidota bacterium]|jgi:hypothetical protein
MKNQYYNEHENRIEFHRPKVKISRREEKVKPKTNSDNIRTTKYVNKELIKQKENSEEDKAKTKENKKINLLPLRKNDIDFSNLEINRLIVIPFERGIKHFSGGYFFENWAYFSVEITEEYKEKLIELTIENPSNSMMNTKEIAIASDYDIHIQIDKIQNHYNYSFSDSKHTWTMEFSDWSSSINYTGNITLKSLNNFSDEEELIQNKPANTFNQFDKKNIENMNNLEVLKGKICPYCNCETKLVTDKEIYGPNSNFNKKFIQCINNNDHYVGTRANGKSLGRLADSELRVLKRKAHALFDPLWEGQDAIFKSRDKAYIWLSRRMNLSNDRTHFAMFDKIQCERSIEIITRFNKIPYWIRKIFII